MLKTTPTQTIPLGALIAAVYEQATGPLAADVVTDLLLRTKNLRALRALQAFATESK